MNHKFSGAVIVIVLVMTCTISCADRQPASPKNPTGEQKAIISVSDDKDDDDKEKENQSATNDDALPGTKEFGLTERQLVSNIEAVEQLIAKCMRKQGFEYVAADYITIKRGMSTDKNISGLSEEEFHEKYGFGVATMYSGKPPQLVDGYSPARVGLGEQNVRIFKNLSPGDQVAYNRALLGEDTGATFAVGLEIEDFSRCGGCTLEAIQQVFGPEQLKATFYNPLDGLIRNDPRMKVAIRQCAEEYRKAGYDYDHPDDVENDVRKRLDAITEGGTIPVEKMSAEKLAAFRELQDYERRVAVLHLELMEEIFDPVEETIEEELYAREVK